MPVSVLIWWKTNFNFPKYYFCRQIFTVLSHHLKMEIITLLWTGLYYMLISLIHITPKQKNIHQYVMAVWGYEGPHHSGFGHKDKVAISPSAGKERVNVNIKKVLAQMYFLSVRCKHLERSTESQLVFNLCSLQDRRDAFHRDFPTCFPLLLWILLLWSVQKVNTLNNTIRFGEEFQRRSIYPS